MRYSVMKEADVEAVARLYMDYYNNHEDGCWQYEKACKRIRQMVTIEDSLCLIQMNDEGGTTGFAIGYFKEYDDITAYYLEEIVILADWQNRGCGRQLLQEIERRALAHGARHIELTSVNDAHHMHFYKGFGLYEATNLRVMGKHYDD
ncbi:MAG: GNAT family N-acetyltransferase [Aristaeellaceae bacterium]